MRKQFRSAIVRIELIIANQKANIREKCSAYGICLIQIYKIKIMVAIPSTFAFGVPSHVWADTEKTLHYKTEKLLQNRLAKFLYLNKEINWAHCQGNRIAANMLENKRLVLRLHPAQHATDLKLTDYFLSTCLT